MGGIPLATLLSLKTGKQIVFVRKEAKKYGTCKFAEGPDVNGKRLLVVEDVITSGGQVIISSKELRESGAIINQCVCVIDREQGGKENLTKDGTTLLPLFTMSKLKELA
jgi:orotate phosphoribosyltransferase